MYPGNAKLCYFTECVSLEWHNWKVFYSPAAASNFHYKHVWSNKKYTMVLTWWTL